MSFAWSAEIERLTSAGEPRLDKGLSGNANEAALALTIYDHNESSERKEFVVGSDGIAADAGSARDDAGRLTSAAPMETAAALTSSIGDFTRTVKINPFSQASRSSPIRLEAASVPECGPAPLPPEKIRLMVERIARRHGVDALFATAITWTESQFDRSRNSDKGARGPMQLMPETARRFGVRDVCDPESNIEGGVKYLRVLLDEFQNPLLVAAAYNAGEGRIYQYGGIPPFKETIGYVAKVVNYQIGMTMPIATKKALAGGRTSPTYTGHETESGIIAVKKTRTFVGGVMHF